MKPITTIASRTYPNTFLENLHDLVEEHLSDSSLTVKKLLRIVGMSRTDLHRKLTSNIGMSATQYLRHIRLCRAATLILQHPEWSIYQIALEVGFSSQSYFTRKFKEEFGICPMAYKEAEKINIENLEHM